MHATDTVHNNLHNKLHNNLHNKNPGKPGISSCWLDFDHLGCITNCITSCLEPSLLAKL